MKIEYNGKVFAIVYRKMDWQSGLTFITEDENYIQVGTWMYDSEKRLAAHKHIENPRSVLLTQEVVYVVTGRVLVYIYDDADIISTVILGKGDLCVLLAGGHGYEIMSNNTQVLEIKNGPFTSVGADKIPING